VRKRGANTEWVARELARAAGSQAVRRGFRGAQGSQRRDHAALHRARGKRAREEFSGLKGEGYEVLSAAPHQRKLPRGRSKAIVS
jgi:tRNA pseudouridine13 synthase